MKISIKFFSFCLLLISSVLFVSCGSSKKGVSKYQEKTYKKLKKELPEASVTIVNDSIKVLFPNHLLFKTGSADLNETVNPTFVRFSKVLNKYNKTKILINGYTDNTGNKDANHVLSQKRAESALKKLVDVKVTQKRLFSWGHGENNPRAKNDTESGREQNRRVEFIVLYDL